MWVLSPVRCDALRSRGLTRLSRQRCFQAASRVDPELAEDLVQVPLDRARAEEQLGADLRVGEPVAGEPGDLLLLRRERLARVERAAAHLPAGRGQLARGADGERLHPDLGEEVLGRPQPLARLAQTALAAQPLAVEQVRAGQLGADSGP